MRSIQGCVFLIVIITSLWVGKTLADGYVIDEGNGLEVCEKYKSSIESALINRFAKCKRNFNPDLADLRNPEWKTIDLLENKELFKKVYKYLRYGDIYGHHLVTDDEQAFLKYLTIWHKNNSYELKVADFDIDNDGRIEIVLKIIEGECETSADAPYFSKIIVLKDMHNIDQEKSGYLNQNILFDKQINHWVDAKLSNDYNQYDVFEYKGTYYFDKSDILNNDGLTVYKLEGNSVSDICHLK